jgi:hypothetical protein
MTSKRGAAQWAQAEMPEWADLVADAQQVRLAGGWVGSLDLVRVRDFLSYATDRLRSRQSDG